jgi:peroxiredoxin
MQMKGGGALKSKLAAIILLTAVSLPLHAGRSLLGLSVPGFTVRDMHGHEKSYPSLKGKVTVVIFFSTRCPMSNAFNYRRNVLYEDFRKQVRFIVIDSNVNESLEEIRTYASNAGFNFPVYQDADNVAANAFGVHATTETFVLDKAGVVRYHGNIEDSPNPQRSTKQALRLAIYEVLTGQPVATPETRVIGCAIRRAHP